MRLEWIAVGAVEIFDRTDDATRVDTIDRELTRIVRAYAFTASTCVLLATSGCFFTTKTETREVVVSIDESAPPTFGAVIGWDVSTRIDVATAHVVVTAQHVRTCTRPRFEVFDEIEHETTDMWWPCSHGGCPEPVVEVVAVGTVVLLPLTLLTALVTTIEIAKHDDTTTRKRRAIDPIRGTCPLPAAHVPVQLSLPSGRVLADTTDADGHALFAIPEGEPATGTASTRVADQIQSVEFFTTTAACEHVRDDMFARVLAAHTLEQRSELLHRLPTACGDTHARTWSLMATVARDAVEARCQPAHHLADQVRASDPSGYTTVFAAEPDIAHCLDGSTEAQQEHGACRERRRAAMIHAQQIEDVAERTRNLTGLPVCDAPSK